MIEQTKTRLQGTLEFKMNERMETFSFSPPKKLVELGKWLLAVTSYEATNSVSNITNENNNFSFTILGHWQTKTAEKTRRNEKNIGSQASKWF